MWNKVKRFGVKVLDQFATLSPDYLAWQAEMQREARDNESREGMN